MTVYSLALNNIIQLGTHNQESLTEEVISKLIEKTVKIDFNTFEDRKFCSRLMVIKKKK